MLEGRLAEEVASVRAGMEAVPESEIWPALLATAFAEMGDLEACRTEYQELAANDFAMLRRNPLNDGAVTASLISDACVGLEDHVGRAVVEGPLEVDGLGGFQDSFVESGIAPIMHFS